MKEKEIIEKLNDHERRIREIENKINLEITSSLDSGFPFELDYEKNKMELHKRTQLLLSKINRTSYSEIRNLSDKDSAIFLLYITSKDFMIDGLISSQIAEILNERFRKDVTSSSIRMALMRADDYIDRKRIKISEKKTAYLYFVSPKVEVYLKEILASKS